MVTLHSDIFRIAIARHLYYSRAMSLTPDDLQAIGKLLEPIREQGKRIEKKLDLLTEDIAGYFHKTWEKMDKQDKQITALEEHTGLTKHN